MPVTRATGMPVVDNATIETAKRGTRLESVPIID
jgi:hypothetical protein